MLLPTVHEQIILEIDKISSNISKVKSTLKSKKDELYKCNENKIKSLSADEIKFLLIKKWINPICLEIDNLGSNSIKKFEKEIKNLAKKYETTFVNLDSQIIDTELQLSCMLADLEANEYDKKGLLEFEKILREEPRIERVVDMLDNNKYNKDDLLDDLLKVLRGE